MPNMYAYVEDNNTQVDIFGLALFNLPTGNNVIISFSESPRHFKLNFPDGSVIDLGKNADNSVYLVERPGKFKKIKADQVSNEIPVNSKKLKNFKKSMAENIIQEYNGKTPKYKEGVRDCFSFAIDIINRKLDGNLKLNDIDNDANFKKIKACN